MEMLKGSFRENAFWRKNNFSANIHIINGNTCLKGKHNFEIKGIAFDFTSEFVLARLEEG